MATNEAAPGSSVLAYHIPTPDATGLVNNVDFAKLYHTHKWVEPVNYIRYSDTVEEAACGGGGLGYCMDDEDMEWLSSFNSKAEGGSGGRSVPTSPVQGRNERRKGKEKEKTDAPTSLTIDEDTFEYIMGVLEKHCEDTVPMLHTNLSLMPLFSQVEPLFSSPLASSFYPSNEVPRALPEPRVLARLARSVFPHWKARRERRQGKSVLPSLNYDETNDGDPYVCFRRRDVRASRKTRRTDNFSVDQFQKLQYELRRAHELATLVLRRETEKKALYSAEKDVWEAKWKLFETKRRWPSLGISREEEEIITGRQSGAAAAAAAVAALNGVQQHPLSAINNNIPRKRQVSEKDKEDRDRRDRIVEASRAVDRLNTTGKSMAPEAIRERLQALHAKLDEELARRKTADSHWDDYTDASYQPLPHGHANLPFRPINVLDPHYRPDEEDEDRRVNPLAFRLRRGRGGRVLLDRRLPTRTARRGPMPTTPDKLAPWLFPDVVGNRFADRRPKSIDQDSDSDDESPRKRQRLNETMRYDASRGGAIGVGMGVSSEDDRIVVDDYDSKYIRHRISLLQEDDLAKLRPDPAPLAQALLDIAAPVELPPPPKFIKPAPTNQMVQYQQQMLQQQQMEQLQRFQIMAQQQQALEQARLQQAQQQQFAAQAQAQAQPQAQANGTANGTPQMAPPNGVPQNGRPPIKRPNSAASQAANSPTPAVNAQQQQQLMAAAVGQQPQVVNGSVMLPNGKPFVPGPGGAPGIPTPAGALDPQIQQQRLAAARVLAAQQAQQAGDVNLDNMTAEQRRELLQLAQQNGFGTNVQAYITLKRNMNMKQLALQQAQAAAAANQVQISSPGTPTANGQNFPSPVIPSPAMTPSQLQLKLPPHAAARLAGNTPPTPQAQAQRS